MVEEAIRTIVSLGGAEWAVSGLLFLVIGYLYRDNKELAKENRQMAERRVEEMKHIYTVVDNLQSIVRKR